MTAGQGSLALIREETENRVIAIVNHKFSIKNKILEFLLHVDVCIYNNSFGKIFVFETNSNALLELLEPSFFFEWRIYIRNYVVSYCVRTDDEWDGGFGR